MCGEGKKERRRVVGMKEGGEEGGWWKQLMIMWRKGGKGGEGEEEMQMRPFCTHSNISLFPTTLLLLLAEEGEEILPPPPTSKPLLACPLSPSGLPVPSQREAAGRHYVVGFIPDRDIARIVCKSEKHTQRRFPLICNSPPTSYPLLITVAEQ